MSTVPPSPYRIKVVALLSGRREETLIDEPLTLATLALLQPLSPLSRILLDGAGLPYRPKGIAVYVDGKRLWQQDCPCHGATDSTTTNGHHGAQRVLTVTFTDAFGDDYDDERLATNRAADAFLRNDQSGRDDAENWAADVLEAAGSLRPKLRPAPPTPDPVVEHAPCPAPRYGDSNVTLGLPYHASGSWRLTYTNNAGPGATDDVDFVPVPIR